MIVRIFNGESVTDYPMDLRTSLSIGSGSKDEVRIADRGLSPAHVRIEREDGECHLLCKGRVFCHGEAVKNASLPADSAFVLGDSIGETSLVCFEPGVKHRCRYPLPGETLTLGRTDNNAVSVSSRLVSRRHCTIELRKDRCWIRDEGSMNGVYVNSRRIHAPTQVASGDEISIGDVTVQVSEELLLICPPSTAKCTVNVPPTTAAKLEEDAQGNLIFQRSPRLKKPIPSCALEIEAPPVLNGKPEINWLSTFLPVVATVGIATVMAVAFSQPMMMLYTLPMTVAGLIVTLTNYRRQKKKYAQQLSARVEKYTEHLDAIAEEVSSIQARQLDAMLYTDPETERCFDALENGSRTLWDRRPIDDDFCFVRIGSGDIPSAAEIKLPRTTLSLEEDELYSRPKELAERFARLKNAPVICRLREEKLCGIVGARTDTVRLIANILTQFTFHQSYTEANLICMYGDEERAMLGWVRGLPHGMDGERKQFYDATTTEQASRLTADFADVLKERAMLRDESNGFGAPPPMLPYLLFVITKPEYLGKDHGFFQNLLRGNDIGVGLILVVEDITLLPKECNLIVSVRGNRGEMFSKDDVTKKQPFLVDPVLPERFSAYSRRMRRILCEDSGKGTAIPKRCTFYEMQGIQAVEEWDLQRYWLSSDITRDLSGPIGLKEGGQTVELDLHENAHGPHGLVAGMTGSGKSEVMLSYLLSLALRYHPYEVGFLIIDFKGGGMVNQLSGLPHLLGAITNIEGGTISRSLSSIKAELIRRQRLFAEAGVNSIDKYIQKYKEGQVAVPLPHLIVLVDEFAELRAEQPDFMKELVSTARIGRSLGIHLILATQKPAGQVSEQIWSNSRFQICLKVATREDSNEVIKSALATTIKEPGRGYLRVGNDEVFTLFQSGYSGEKLPDREQTQLEAVVAHIAGFCTSQGIERLPSIILPALPTQLPFPERSVSVCGGQLNIGIYDDPDNQYQGTFGLDCFSKNTLIVGAPLSGKTNLLQTILRSVAESYSSEEVNVYILDFASMILKSFEKLPHVGSVVTRTEEEKLKNLLKLLDAEIEERRKSFLALGVSSYASYLEAGKRDKPRIMLLIDDLTALRELYFQEEDPLLILLQSSLSYGISVVAANTQTNGLGYKYLANFSNRLALFCNDAGEYSTLFDHCALRIPDIHGRCIVEKEKACFCCQTYLSFAGEKEVERAGHIKAWIRQIAANNPINAKAIPEIPERIEQDVFLRTFAPLMQDSGTLVIGMDYETVDPVSIRPNRLGVLGLAGGSGNEERDFIHYFLWAWETLHPGGLSVYIADDLNRGLEGCAGEAHMATYSFLPAKAPETVKLVEAELARRYEALMNGGTHQNEDKLLLLAICGTDCIESICGDPVALSAYRNIIGKYKALNVCVLLCGFENVPISFNSPELLKTLRENQKLLFFEEIGGLKLIDLPYAIQKKYRRTFLPDDAFFVNGSECLRLKMPHAK